MPIWDLINVSPQNGSDHITSITGFRATTCCCACTTGSEPFLIIDAARLGQHQVVQCGAEVCRISTSWKDRKDERSSRSCSTVAAHRAHVRRPIMADSRGSEPVEHFSVH